VQLCPISVGLGNGPVESGEQVAYRVCWQWTQSLGHSVHRGGKEISL